MIEFYETLDFNVIIISVIPEYECTYRDYQDMEFTKLRILINIILN